MSQPAEILIVDDDPGMLETLGDVLDHAGYHVDTAEQGHAGLERVILDPPIDLAIVDFKLPDVSGLDVLRSIKTRSASTEVILMSGYASLASVLEAMEGQAASYVVKPFDFLQLRAMVARTLSRQRVARALRESEQHHRLVVDAMSDPAFLLDVDGSILLGNTAAYRLSGYRPEGLHDVRIEALLPGDAVRFIQQQLGTSRAGGLTAAPFDTALLTKSGRRVGAKLSVFVVRDAAGRPTGASVIVRDLVAHDRGVQMLRSFAGLGRDLLATHEPSQLAERIVTAALSLFEARRAVLCEVDRESEVLRSVAAAASEGDPRRFVGWSLPLGVGIAGRAVREGRVVQTPDAGAGSDLAAAPEGEEQSRGREAHGAGAASIAVPLTAHGETLGALLIAVSAGHGLGADGIERLTVFADQAAGAVANARLFAESERRRRSAERLAEAVAVLPRALGSDDIGQQIADGVARAMDAQGVLVFRVDPESARLVPIATAGDIGPRLAREAAVRAATSLVDVAVRERHPIVSRDILTDTRVELGPDLRMAAERAGARAMVAVPLVAHEHVTGALVLTDRAGKAFTGHEVQFVQAVASHVAVALEYERLRGERSLAFATLEVSQHRLIESERLQAIGAMASGMSHYMKNVLQSLLGRISLIARRVDDPEIGRSLGAAQMTVMDAVGTLRNLDAFAEPASLSETQPLDVNRVVREAIGGARGTWRAEARARGIEIDVELEAGELPLVAGEPAAVLEVLSIVLLNAVDASPQGGSIAIKTWATEESVYCSVTDSGIGMSDEARQRALEPFFTTKGGDRKGLGLSVAYGDIRRHGGTIQLARAQSGGTVVMFSLPRSPWAP